ncbi:D-inositol-3-phosphate glycosyltransferase [Peribacillus frigoritolerans]|uniref:glycosyltransferase family 4 protein n=1 Tax=Peribacillus frigoritolerans TaxID=450367 RepID=UPI0030CAADD6
MEDKKLIYIMNEYSDKSVQHFYHVINLLEKIADQGVDVAIVIEKCKSIPNIPNKRIQVIGQKETTTLKRALELKNILKNLMEDGYKKVFVRISTNAAILAILIARKYKGEVYYWNSGDNLTYDRKKKGFDKIKWILTGYSKLFFIKKYVSHFVTGPETMIEYYIKNLKIKRSKMLLLYNDIDISRFNNGTNDDRYQLRKKLGLPMDSQIVLFVHRFTPVKRFYLQIPFVAESEEFRKNNAYLLVIGEGPDEEKIKSQVLHSGFKDRVILLGAIPNSEIQQYYSGADIFINPSYSEGFPRVVIEAMACGLPVVATDVGGTKDIIGEMQSNYVLDKDDKVTFREKVNELLGNVELREKIKSENLNYVKKFSTENVSKMYIDKIFRR